MVSSDEGAAASTGPTVLFSDEGTSVFFATAAVEPASFSAAAACVAPSDEGAAASAGSTVLFSDKGTDISFTTSRFEPVSPATLVSLAVADVFLVFLHE